MDRVGLDPGLCSVTTLTRPQKLRIELYVKDDESRVQSPGARVQVHRMAIPVEELIQGEMRSNKGPTLICGEYTYPG